ncbi:MAG: hypothetical protein ACI9J2_000990 [Saprospiraceae bacterium]|jgi:hypothetical protein
MFNSSPITTWEGAAAFFPYAGSGGAVFWFWVCMALLVVPLYTAFKAEKAAESTHG